MWLISLFTHIVLFLKNTISVFNAFEKVFMNILLINHSAGSIKHGMELRPYYFAREWVKAGHNVTIVAASFVHFRNRNLKGTRLQEEVIDNINYIWLPVPVYHDNGYERITNIKAFVDELVKSKQKLIELKPNIVVNSSICPVDAYISYEIAKAANAKFVAGVHDVWELLPMTLDDMIAFNTEMHNAEAFRCSKADKIITALPNFKEYLKSYGLEDRKIWYIPNGVNLDEYKEFVGLSPEISNVLYALRNEGKFLIGYAGTLDEEKAINVFIDTAKELQDKPIQFVVLGNGQEKKALQEQVIKCGLTNVIFFDAIPKNMVNAFLKAMDCLYAGWQKNDVYRFGMSNNKICEYMFSSKPIIHSVSVDEDLVKRTGCGISVPAEVPMAVVEAVKEMVSLTATERFAMGQRGRDYVSRQLNYRTLAEWYLHICRVM